MCSSTRGPAIAPSLVTCPTRKTGNCRGLANCMMREVHSRTWLTLPAADVEFVEIDRLNRVDDQEARI